MKKGSKMTLEQRQRVSKAQKIRFSNPEERKKIGEFFKGKHPKSEFKKGHTPIAPFKKGQIPWNKDEKIGKILICSICKKEFYARPSAIKRGRKYCSHSCMVKDPQLIKKLSESHKGQIPTNLEQLRKISIGHTVSEEARKKISISNKGRKHSKEAIEKNRLAHLGGTPWNKGKKFPEFSGQNHPMFGKQHTSESLLKMSETHKKIMSNPEFRKRLSEIHNKRLSNPEEMKRQSEISTKTLLRLYESGAFPRQTNTKPERQIKEELLKRGYVEGEDFIHQYKFMNKFMCDFCFPQQKVIIEADGDYYHANPKKYPYDPKNFINKLTGRKLHKEKQIKNILRDKSKDAYIKKIDNSTWTLLRFWESDIKKDVVGCVDKIKEVLGKRKL